MFVSTGSLVPMTLWKRIGFPQRRCAASVTAASSCLGSTGRCTSSSSPLARTVSMYWRISPSDRPRLEDEYHTILCLRQQPGQGNEREGHISPGCADVVERMANRALAG